MRQRKVIVVIIGVPKEVKSFENRVAMTPAGVVTLTTSGHTVLIESGAGDGSGFTNEEYKQAGAKMMQQAADVWAQADMIIKVKEPLESEFSFFRKGLILFTYLHLAAEAALTEALVKNEVIAVAYETVEHNRTLPLLTPMSEVAGRMATQMGARFLEKTNGGKGILLSGVPGVKRAKVAIVGGGVVGTNAAKMAIGLGAQVTLLDVSAERLRQLDDLFGHDIQTMMSNPLNIAVAVEEADLVIGAVLIPGAKAPRLITEEMIKTMKEGSVVVDVAVDQGGIVETANRVTTHDQPTYVKHGIIHYAVANMPGAVPRTSTIALTNVTIPYAKQIADLGIIKALGSNLSLAKGLNTAAGYVTYEAVATDLGFDYKKVDEAIPLLY